MSGPWEKFQSNNAPPAQAEGPWSKFANGPVEEPKDTSFKGLLQNVVSKLTEGVSGLPGQEQKGLPKTLGQAAETAVSQFGAGFISPMPGSSFNLPVRAMTDNSNQVGKEVEDATGSKLAGIGASIVTDPTTFITVGGLAKGGGKLLKAGAEVAGEVMESTGAKAVNYAAGLRETTLKAMTKAGENPVDVGVKVGKELAKDKILAFSPKTTYDNLVKAVKTAGVSVQSAIENIKKADSKFSLKGLVADKALQPLKHKLKEFSGAITGVKKAMGKHFEEVHNYLVTQAAKNDGFIQLEDIRKAMDEVGPLTHKGAEEVQQVMSELYGTLANVQDNMITQIAESVGKPALKEALLSANKKYSLYRRLLPDIQKQALKAGTGKGSVLAHPIESAQKAAANFGSRAAIYTGEKLKGLNTLKEDAALKALQEKMKNASK